MTSPSPIRLFSYGTLRQEAVQLALFGRPLHGEADTLAGYRIELIEITDPGVVETSGERYHTVAVPSADPDSRVDGMVFSLSEAELAAADGYETADYRRVSVGLRSGVRAWVYVRA